MSAPTPRQLAVLRFIAAGIDRGLPPTMHEIGAAFGMHYASAGNHIYSLATKGLVTRVPGAARALELTDLGRHYAPIRLVTGIVDRPYCRCAGCSREFYGRKNFIAHRCAEKDKRAA